MGFATAARIHAVRPAEQRSIRPGAKTAPAGAGSRLASTRRQRRLQSQRHGPPMTQSEHIGCTARGLSTRQAGRTRSRPRLRPEYVPRLCHRGPRKLQPVGQHHHGHRRRPLSRLWLSQQRNLQLKTGQASFRPPARMSAMAGATGLFQQSGGTNAATNLTIGSGGTYRLSGGTLAVGGTRQQRNVQRRQQSGGPDRQLPRRSYLGRLGKSLGPLGQHVGPTRC